MNQFFFFSKVFITIIIILQINYYLKLEKKSIQFESFDGPFKMNNYSFYNSLDFPIISIILDFRRLKLDYFKYKEYIFNLLQQAIKDIEIIIYLYYKDITNNILINNFSKFDKRVSVFITKKKHIINDIFKISNIIKGKFILMIDNIIYFNNGELLNIFNYTKGKIDNIFNFRTISNYNLSLIRTKVFIDIVDICKKFLNFQELINYIKTMDKPKLSYVPIALSPNDKYTPLAYTSMISILSTKNYCSYIEFYLIISKNFNPKNYILFDSLYEQFFFFNITYIKMDERYKNAFVHRYITNQAYYRFSLGNLLPNLNKIIYLDADTICFRDLSNLYELNFKGKIFLGKGLNRNKTNLEQIHINSGILLMNLKKMRKKKIEQKVLKILNNGFTHPTLHDQAVIDIYLYKYVGLLPPEYNSYYLNHTEIYKLIKSSKIYDKDKLLFSLKYPIIRHYKGDFKDLNDDWFFFARKSKFFKKICMNYSFVYNYS